jgi:hypothetical protein
LGRMKTSPDPVRRWFALLIPAAFLGLVYSVWLLVAGKTGPFRVIMWLLAVPGALLLYMIVAAEAEISRRRRALAEMSCPSCGAHYGTRTALEARSDYLKRRLTARRRNEKRGSPFDKHWHVRCPRCQKEVQFETDTYKLEV